LSTENPLISIIITNYNGGDLLLKCLESVYNSNYVNYEIILVDNASDDNSHLNAHKKFTEIKLVSNNKNLGAVGRNSGIKIAKGEFIVLLDNDTKVNPNWLDEFLKNYETHGYGMYQAKLLLMDEPKKINSAGCMINIFGFSFARGTGEIDIGQYDQMYEINFPATACAFIPKKIFDEVGLFDEKFFAYLDDTDFGWRAMKQGIKSFFAPSVIVYHKWSSTTKWSPLKYYLLERNRLICINTLFSKKTILKLRPFLKFIDFGVTKIYKKNGMLEEKKRADEFIEDNKEYLERKNIESQKKTIIDDFHVIKKFSDCVSAPKESFEGSWILNSFLCVSSKIAKFFMK
jgi:GT2 family glycosyltransferase